ncbi:DUF2927 domain-containing protein [Fulvivirga sedimenti]|uniref:DUF2927 domain-containing protein n=1 Tax=Fulvivirga sedimenti TaxID=2879465 RepID=A0A9X1L1C3_9BACT|nr:DUF2927 domain-containing protein [Fulvivirga sedimenti]MCA6078724.1 DUF2927 domain-containing protein [Fulvivirga sedimenti]
MIRKYRHLWVLLLLPAFVACSDDDVVSREFTPFQEEAMVYFNEIALGFEFGQFPEITRKWKVPMRVFIGGRPDSRLLQEFADIKDEINSLATDGFEMIEVQDSLEANYYLFFGSGTEYVKHFPYQSEYVPFNWGLFYLVFNQRAEFIGGHMYVDIDRANNTEQLHLLREELTQSLGLAKDSKRYPTSIFQQDWTTTTNYAEIDRELIRLLYNPNMVVGVSAAGSTAIIKNIYREENAD